ncbi:MAG: PepSY-like domain-containing protein [Tannerellaceae bacterium]
MKSKVLLTMGSALIMQSTFAVTIPSLAQNYIEKNFPHSDIAHVSTTRGFWGIKTYDVILTNGFSIAFDKDGTMVEIDGGTKTLPKRVIPKPIATYSDKNFPSLQIVSIGKYNWGYEVKLTDGILLDFDSSYRFIEVEL